MRVHASERRLYLAESRGCYKIEEVSFTKRLLYVCGTYNQDGHAHFIRFSGVKHELSNTSIQVPQAKEEVFFCKLAECKQPSTTGLSNLSSATE